MRVIGIAGQARSGKGTVAGFLAAELVDRGYQVLIDSFATEVKRMARLCGWNGVKDARGRGLLQRVGAWGRARSRWFWVGRLERRVMSAEVDFVIVPDARFRNEVAWCGQHGACWRVVGRGGLEGAAGADASETELDGAPPEWFSVTFLNDGSLEDLRDAVAHEARNLVSEAAQPGAAVPQRGG